MSENKLEVIEKGTPLLLKEANKIVIKNDTSLKKAVTTLSVLNGYKDRIEETKNKVMRPLLDAVNAERARWKPIESSLNEAITGLRDKMSVYQTQKVKEILKIEEENAQKLAEGKITLEEAVEELKPVKTKVTTDSGMVNFREEKILVIEHLKLIPREYLIPDEKKIKADLLAGKKIKGAKLDIKSVPVNYR